jgi:hypothetical protein
MTSALNFYKTSFLGHFFICILNFRNLGNFVTVGDTFISKLTFKIKKNPLWVYMKTTTGILRAIIEICVSKQTSAIYFFEVGMTKMKCQNKRQNEMNLI